MSTPFRGRDAQEQELHIAAFNAWVLVGDMLGKPRPPRESIEAVYDALTAALKRYDPPE